MSQPKAARNWRREVQTYPEMALLKAYPHEAVIHRRMLTHRGFTVAHAWRNFRTFLLELGPAPDSSSVLIFVHPDDPTYGPGRVRWGAAGEQTALPRRAGDAAQDAPINLADVDPRYIEASRKTGIPLSSLLATLNRNSEPQAVSANSLVDAQAPWLPADEARRKSFIDIYWAWHRHVHPQNTRLARPEFLFLLTATPVLRDCRDTLMAAGLWEPATMKGEQERERHPARKKYLEFLSQAQLALLSLPRYSDYCLRDDLDALIERLTADEERLRGEPIERAAHARPARLYET